MLDTFNVGLTYACPMMSLFIEVNLLVPPQLDTAMIEGVKNTNIRFLTSFVGQS